MSLTCHLYVSSLRSHPGCQQNYHKRCAIKIPNNCSRIDITHNKTSSNNHLSSPRTHSGNSNSSSTNDDLLSGSASSLVRKMQQMMNDITQRIETNEN